MTSAQRQSAIDRVEETITVLESFRDSGDKAIYQRYRAKISENIVDAVVALTAERTPEELAHVAERMQENRKRWRGLRWAERQP